MTAIRKEEIRWLEPEDMTETAELEALCFPSSWTAGQFSDAWKQAWFAGYGIFHGSRMLGYVTLSVLAGELEVLNVAVRPESRGKGLSRPLMAFALEDALQGNHLRRRGLSPQGWERGVLEVRTGNAPARALYASLGFTAAGLRRHYYGDGEDALVMTLTADDFLDFLKKRPAYPDSDETEPGRDDREK